MWFRRCSWRRVYAATISFFKRVSGPHPAIEPARPQHPVPASAAAVLMGVVFSRRNGGAAHERSSWSTGAQVWADGGRALGSRDDTDAQPDGAGCV